MAHARARNNFSSSASVSGGRTACAATGDALSKTRCDDLEPGSVKCAGHRRELGHYVLAVTSLLDHRYHSGELSLSSPQSIEHRSDAVLVTSHFPSISCCSHVTPWGMCPAIVEYPMGYRYQ